VLSAAYKRRLGRNIFEAERQEELLKDARAWAEAELREGISQVRDVDELKKRVVKQTWDKFVPTHRHYSAFQLGYREFESALWEEGLPSLEDLATAAMEERAAPAKEAISSRRAAGAERQANAAELSRPEAAAIDSRVGGEPLERLRRSFDAVATYELRRGEILKELTKALEAYLASCSRSRDVEWDRVRELLGAACRAFYDSLATSYLSVEPPIDPEELFGERGELFGGCTHFDFEKALTLIKVRTPSHWPPPQMWQEGDSPEDVRMWTQTSRDLNKEIRMGPHLEGHWLNDWVSEGVKAWRPKFERRFTESQARAGTNWEQTTAPPTATEPSPPRGAYLKRAAWLAAELAIREWSVHDLEAQRGPNWKTSRKVLDGLPVSRSVLEKTAAALSTPEKQVLLKDIPID
jgi:hypothetical protein